MTELDNYTTQGPTTSDIIFITNNQISMKEEGKMIDQLISSTPEELTVVELMEEVKTGHGIGSDKEENGEDFSDCSSDSFLVDPKSKDPVEKAIADQECKNWMDSIQRQRQEWRSILESELPDLGNKQ
jgi:hypothetical protein